jgi:hypothetical protein
VLIVAGEELFREVMVKRVKRTPNPDVHGGNADPSFIFEEDDISYSCKRCGIESKNMEEVITPNRPESRSSGLIDRFKRLFGDFF